jgi:hypothetical protein
MSSHTLASEHAGETYRTTLSALSKDVAAAVEFPSGSGKRPPLTADRPFTAGKRFSCVSDVEQYVAVYMNEDKVNVTFGWKESARC